MFDSACVCVLVRVCMCLCVRRCVRVSVRACVGLPPPPTGRWSWWRRWPTAEAWCGGTPGSSPGTRHTSGTSPALRGTDAPRRPGNEGEREPIKTNIMPICGPHSMRHVLNPALSSKPGYTVG